MSDGVNKKMIVGATAAVLLLAVLAVGIFSVDWSDYTTSDTPQEQPTFPTDDEDSIWEMDEDGNYVTDENGDKVLKEESLAYTIFEEYGLILIPLALLMFGAMVGGVVISREDDVDDSD